MLWVDTKNNISLVKLEINIAVLYYKYNCIAFIYTTF